MGSFIKTGGRNKGGSSRRGFSPVAEINVTPMVDVMLVLLVIFIVTAPLLTSGVNVNLPQTKSTKSLPQDNKALTLYVEKDGSLTLNEAKVDAGALQARLDAIRQSNPQVRVYVKGDRDVSYGLMMQVMASVTAAGITQVAFVTEPQKTPRAPR
jgi:biopolymer transport protein TolR